jgi:hypothetical protein
MHTGFWWGDQRKGNNVGRTRRNGRTILKRILKQWDGDIDWIDLLEIRRGGRVL